MVSGRQSASRVILVRPSGFAHDPLTASSNAFQHDLADRDVRVRAEAEFDGLLLALDRCGIGTTVLDPVDPRAPNGVFPNNWFSTHGDGTLMLYPMLSPSRRAERDPAMDRALKREGFFVERVIDLSALEEEERYLEGTGSLVLDRARGLAFAALSPRTSERALTRWCAETRYAPVPFLATMDGTLAGQLVYHTNVVMSIGDRFAVVCLDAMPYPTDRDDVRTELERGGKDVIPIDLAQMHAFVGNMLQVQASGQAFLFLSDTAFRALRPEQRLGLERYAQLVPVAVPTIETVGGGSVRCMLAENFLSPVPRGPQQS
jgi:hypothetical protein